MPMNISAAGAAIDAFGSAVPAAAGGADSGSNSTSSAAVTAASLHTSTDAQLQVRTLEGDTVTLSASFGADLTLASLGASSNGSGASARYASLEIQRSVTLQIQGDLSAKEMADIAKLVKSFLHDLKSFLRDGGSAATVSANPEGISTIASSQEQFAHSGSLTLVAAGAQSQASAAGAKPSAAPMPLMPATGEGAPGLPAPVVPTGDSDGDHDGSDAGRRDEHGGLNDLIGRLLHDAGRAGVSGRGLFRMIEHALGALRRDPEWSRHATTIAHAQAGLKQGLAVPQPVAPVLPAGPGVAAN